MSDNFQPVTDNLNSSKQSSKYLFFQKAYFFSYLSTIQLTFAYFFCRSNLFQQIFFALLFSLSFYSHALKPKQTNVINDSKPYLTFNGNRTCTVNIDNLLEISLSDGTRYTPSTNNSSINNPIKLPGRSFADISMLVPTNINSVALSTFIGSKYTHSGDDVNTTGTLNVSIVDKNNQAVSRNTVLDICKAPYQVKLSSTAGSFNNGESTSCNFSASNVTYYITPNESSAVCFARPNLRLGKLNEKGLSHDYRGPASVWNPDKGFLTQSSYNLNFPTTGAHGLYFDLLIEGSNKPLSWSPVSHGGITATMTNSTATSVRVTLTGPVATESQSNSSNPGLISKPTLPQTFELIGRDSSGNPIVKYGFELKQWFIHQGISTYLDTLSWCKSIGYRPTKISDLTNASCRGTNHGSWCKDSVGATPSSPNNLYQRQIGAGLFTEWGAMDYYSGAGFYLYGYWANDLTTDLDILNTLGQFYVASGSGSIDRIDTTHSIYGICTYP